MPKSQAEQYLEDRQKSVPFWHWAILWLGLLFFFWLISLAFNNLADDVNLERDFKANAEVVRICPSGHVLYRFNGSIYVNGPYRRISLPVAQIC